MIRVENRLSSPNWGEAATLSAIFAVLDRTPAALRVPVLRLLVSVLISIYARVQVIGIQNVPDEPVLYVSNHLSNIDALILGAALKKNRPVVLAGVKLKGTRLTRLVMDLVEVVMIEPNSPDIDAVRGAIDTLKSGRSVLIFPEGGRSRVGSLIRAKAGASVIARRAQVKVLPLALMGTEKLLPIDDSNMGGERLKPAHVTLKVGEPFAVDEVTILMDNGREDRQATADAMMKRIADLLDAQYQGVYAPGSDISAGTIYKEEQS